MLEHFFSVPLDPGRKLQQQIQERIIEAILAGSLPSHEPLPATRILARDLGVARNTISLVYERLAEDGYLKPVKRRGYFIDERYVREQLNLKPDGAGRALFPAATPVDYAARIAVSYAGQRNIVKPRDWRRYPYPFIFGQVTPDRTSLSRWRDCIRQAGTTGHVSSWAADLIDADDPMLVDQIIRRVLPKRGFRADPAEVMITVGAQHAVFLVAQLLCRPGTVVGFEEPGYPDARNTFLARGARLKPQAVDGNGMRVAAEDLAGCDLVYVTPGHQSPTNVTMTLERRLQLMAAAEAGDFLVVEDDYEHELNFVGRQRPALKSLDTSGRVIHIGSLSKPLFPGLRLGFLVAPRPLMAELRALRRLMCRHPSALDQRAMAIFFADGHFDAHIRRQRSDLAQRWKTILKEIEARLPDCDVTMTTGGSGLWVTLPKGTDARLLAAAAAEKGVLVEPGDVCYLRDNPPLNRIRMGFAAIPGERIAPGVALLAEALREVRPPA